MIIEFISYLLMMTPDELKKFGDGYELLAIGARYRRGGDAWAPHLTTRAAGTHS